MNINELKKAYEAMEAAGNEWGKAYDKVQKAKAFVESAEQHKVKTSDMVRSTYELWGKGMFVDNTEMLAALARLHKAEAFCADALRHKEKTEEENRRAERKWSDAVETWEATYLIVRDYLRDHGPVVINLMRGPEHVCEMLGMEYSRGDRPYDPDALHMIAEIRKYTCQDFINFDLINIEDEDGIIIPGIMAYAIKDA